MAERKIDPKFNIHESYKRVNIVNPYRFEAPTGSLIDEPNMLTMPNAYEDAYWTKSGATILSTTEVAPDGTNTARKVSVNASSAGVYKLIDYSIVSAHRIRLSVWFKASAPTDIIIGFNGKTKGGNNRVQTQNITTEWTKYTYVLEPGVVLSDTGLYVLISATRISNNGNVASSFLDVGGSRTLDVWGASFNIS